MLRRLIPTLLVGALLTTPLPALAAAAPATPAAAELITVERSVVVDVPVRRAFRYAADFLNDPEWRAEVNTMTVDGPRRIGAVYAEDSHLGLRPHWVTLTRLTVWQPRRRVVAETLPTSPYYLRSGRTFERISPRRTRMTYRLEYAPEMADAVFGIRVPPVLVEVGYSAIMASYLAKLRHLFRTGRA